MIYTLQHYRVDATLGEGSWVGAVVGKFGYH
uniref:Uncharacterized protein n=1 Tax=Candidatus Methanogaster sp. ANME-2c ERB4 TaxID=2759911 RepID=A0A7G9YLK7_9EURY|nr:hypothetical protein JFFFLBDL_00016 [Methanosarcinales archaeon ANME-2c ERB4]